MSGEILSMTPLDQVWVLVTGAMVFIMQAGFLCVEAGLSRSKHSMNVAVKNVTDYFIATVFFYLIGYGWMFGTTWQGLIGTNHFAPRWEIPGEAVFFFFQLAFAGASTTIVSGAMAERMKFKAYLVYAAVMAAVFYPLFGHWVWGGAFHTDQQGWLAKLGYLDFAGSSVVHQAGGWMALAGIIVLGPRLGKFDAQGLPKQILGHNIPLAMLGVFILWFGWLGFNGGSTLAMNGAVGPIIVNTNLTGAAASLAAMVVGWRLRGHPDLLDIGNGALGGLVAITAGAAYVTPISSLLIGIIAGFVVVASGEWLERGLKLDDVVGAIPVHGFCGLWGVLAAGIFAKPEFLLHPDNRLYQIGIQALGSGVCFLLLGVGGWLFFKALDRVMHIRVSPAAEGQGLNYSEHQAVSDLQRLGTTMESIAADRDWSRRTDIDPYADAGELGVRFNQLLETIERAFSELREQQALVSRSQQELLAVNGELTRAKSGLEKQVQQRTSELLAAKASLEQQISVRTRELQCTNMTLEEKVSQLELLNQVMIGREERIIELKEQLEALRLPGPSDQPPEDAP